MNAHRIAWLALALALVVVSAAAPVPAPADTPAATVSLNKDDYPVFPHADQGADAAVPAEQGGKGFRGEGWETNTTFGLIGDPRALKGGKLVRELTDFPNNLRPEGPAANTMFNYMTRSMMFETLLNEHPTTLEWIPGLATHWKLSADKQTYWYRIDPNARWADGSPITAEDVVATWEFMMDDELAEPSSKMTYGKFEKPVAESKYIVRVKCVKPNWRNFIYFSGAMFIYPAKVLKAQPVKQWLDKYNFSYMMGCGAYYGELKDVDKDKQTIKLRRRTDYWAADYRRNIGQNNFDELVYIVIPDENIAFESFKKGDIDIFVVSRAKMWAEDCDFPNIKRGLVQKRRIFNEEPHGIYGIAFNMQREPFTDLRVRKAFTLLLDRKKLLEKLMYDAYVPLNSYHAGGEYENKDNPKNEFNPEEAQKLLAEAGWKEVDDKGRLVKDGKPLEVALEYAQKTFEKHLTVYQEDLANAGISLTLRFVPPETQWKNMTEKKFQMTVASWGALIHPNPETSFHSRLAKETNNNNITGLADPKIDDLCAKYDTLEDQKERAAVIRQIDGILAQTYPYALFWHAPYVRVLYWNKLGVPEFGLPRIGDTTTIETYWWFDPEKAKALEAARKDESKTFPAGEADIRYWEKWRAGK